eukprot:gene11732-biopygen3378
MRPGAPSSVPSSTGASSQSRGRAATDLCAWGKCCAPVAMADAAVTGAAGLCSPPRPPFGSSEMHFTLFRRGDQHCEYSKASGDNSEASVKKPWALRREKASITNSWAGRRPEASMKSRGGTAAPKKWEGGRGKCGEGDGREGKNAAPQALHRREHANAPRSVLFCSVLFCSVLFCYVLSCSVLFCSVLLYSALFCSVPSFLTKPNGTDTNYTITPHITPQQPSADQTMQKTAPKAPGK